MLYAVRAVGTSARPLEGRQCVGRRESAEVVAGTAPNLRTYPETRTFGVEGDVVKGKVDL